MNKGFVIVATIAATVIALASWHLWQQPEASEPRQQSASTPANANSVAQTEPARTATWPPPFPERNDDMKYVPLLPVGPQLSATQSLVAARDGDPRTPPIERSQSAADAPVAPNLDDHKAYQQYEAQQNTRLYAAYVQAAEEEIPRLRAAIARAREMGLSTDEIAIGEEKLRRITSMQEQMRKEHPELQNGRAKEGVQ